MKSIAHTAQVLSPKINVALCAQSSIVYNYLSDFNHPSQNTAVGNCHSQLWISEVRGQGPIYLSVPD